MGLLGRIRLALSAPPAPAALPTLSVPAPTGPELGEEDLEQVVGGLERVYVPGMDAAA